MITETGIKCFLELSKTLNFTAAAENLYMTQQAVSKQIESLESSLDVILFVRSRRSVLLTEEGERLARLFTRFRTEFEDCIEECRRNVNLRSNTLLAGYQNWTYYSSAPPKADIMMRSMVPNFNLIGEMHSPYTLLYLLSKGKLDLIMLYQRLAGDLNRYRCLELKEIPIVIMASKIRAATVKAQGFADFASDPLIMDANEYEIEMRKSDSEIGKKYGLTPEKVLIRPNRDSVYLSVEMGQGITLGSSMSMIENRAIEKYPTGYTDKLICMWRNCSQNKLAESYAQCLREAFQEE